MIVLQTQYNFLSAPDQRSILIFLAIAAAFIGIAIALWKPTTKFPHMGHVLLSTWASLFSFTAFGVADWLPLIPFIFIFLFLAVWLPCCVSDIIYPLLWVRGDQTETREGEKGGLHHH